jgi:hypothetical protein
MAGKEDKMNEEKDCIFYESGEYCYYCDGSYCGKQPCTNHEKECDDE